MLKMKRKTLSVIVIISFIVGWTSVIYGAEPLRPKSTMLKSVKASNSQHIMLIAHRGTPQNNPEHSIAGYRLAISQGSIFIEPDLVMSKDGVIYVCHDRNLKRTTGKNVDITKTNSKKLDKIKLENGEKLHRLSEVFDEFGDSVFYVAETKNIGGKQARQMDRAFIKLVKQYQLQKRIMLQSQSLDSLKAVHKVLKSMPYMYITQKDSGKGLIKKLKILPSWIDAVSISHTKITKKVREITQKRHIKVALYTVKNQVQMKKVLQYKPDMIFTNSIEMSKGYLRKL
jgi:glycerophosphoryl diester phosphodiesterase